MQHPINTFTFGRRPVLARPRPDSFRLSSWFLLAACYLGRGCKVGLAPVLLRGSA